MLPKMPIKNNGDKPTFADEPTLIWELITQKSMFDTIG